jgi:glycosyltransferase involved in cell wall biosynthesis
MKIIYLHQYFIFPNEPGGTRSYDLASGFLRSGHNVEIISSTSNPKYKNDDSRWVMVKKDGLVVHYTYLPYSNDLTYKDRIIIFFKFLFFSSIKLINLKADLVLATSTPLTIGIPALLNKWLCKTPFIFEVRDVWPEAPIAVGAIKNKVIKKLLFYLENLIYKNAAAIVPLSIDMRYSILSRNPVLKRKPVEVIENISEITRFQSGYFQDSSLLTSNIGFKPRFSILYAGSFGKVNGLNYVVELAYKLIKIDSSIVFILVGDGQEKKSVIKNAKSKKVLNKNLFILDWIAKQDLPQLYYECDMGSSFVIPIIELWANSANKFFDTLAAKKPILINYEGWQKELIQKENIGFVLPSTLNNDQLIKDFVKYTYDDSLIHLQKESAIKIAKEKYSTNTAVKKYNKIFKSIKTQ